MHIIILKHRFHQMAVVIVGNSFRRHVSICRNVDHNWRSCKLPFLEEYNVWLDVADWLSQELLQTG